jgi:hypothetical protein
MGKPSGSVGVNVDFTKLWSDPYGIKAFQQVLVERTGDKGLERPLRDQSFPMKGNLFWSNEQAKSSVLPAEHRDW